MRTTVRLDEDLLREAKAHAAATRRTLTQVIEDALRESLARRAATAKHPRIELPVFRGSGVQPGVNLDSNAALLDIMEGTE